MPEPRIPMGVVCLANSMFAKFGSYFSCKKQTKLKLAF